MNAAHAQLSALGGVASSLGGMRAGATGVGVPDARAGAVPAQLDV